MSDLDILIIDDDAKLGELLKEYLVQFGIRANQVLDPDVGISTVFESRPDLVVLDVMMPGKSGFDVCREIRQAGNDVPILMLTARGDTTDRVVGLELGADDYLPKPFEPRELAARIRAIAKRSQGRVQTESQFKRLEYKGLKIDGDLRTVELDSTELLLTSTEYEALVFLASQPGKKVSRDEMMNFLNGVDTEVQSRSVDILISRLRLKLRDDAKNPRYIKTIRGMGYVFVGEKL